MIGKTVKYGILGCGNHAFYSHAIPCKKFFAKELELVSICDISSDRMKQFELEYGSNLKQYLNRAEFFRSGIEFVLVGTPDKYHFSDLKSIMDFGLPAFVEKPLVVNSVELKGLWELLKSDQSVVKSDQLISSCHPRRFDPGYVWLKENLDNLVTELGKVVEFKFDFSYHKPLKKWKQNRGLLLDHLNHEIDLLHYLFGVDSFESWRLQDKFDAYSVFGARDDGIKFSFSGTRKLQSRIYSEFLYLRFERGDLKLDNLGRVEINNHEGSDSKKCLNVGRTDYENRGYEVIKNFVNVLNKVDDCYLSKEDLYVNNAMGVMLTENKYWKYEKNKVL